MIFAMTEDQAIHEKTREIKKELRLAMNGVVSSLQRNQGLNYKINFGVEIPRLKNIAAGHEKDERLALRLWQDDIRECKMLAIFLMPEEGYAAVAEKWIAETPFTEIADHLAMTLLNRLPDAAERATAWIQNGEGMYRYCGFMTMIHLMRKGTAFTSEQERIFLATARSIEDIDRRGSVIMAARKALDRYCDEE